MTPEACWLVVSRSLCAGESSEADLHDGNVGALLHFESGVHETVLGDPGIGVDEQDDLSTSSSAHDLPREPNQLTF